MKLANTIDSKSVAERLAGASPASGTMDHRSSNTAYVIGFAIGNGNLSNVCVYSNELEAILGWKALAGSKFEQNIRVPAWVFGKKEYVRNCLRGLFETDGSVYKDRSYTYANFTTIIHGLSQDVQIMIDSLGYRSTTQSSVQKTGKRKFVTRVCRNSLEFIKEISMQKE